MLLACRSRATLVLTPKACTEFSRKLGSLIPRLRHLLFEKKTIPKFPFFIAIGWKSPKFSPSKQVIEPVYNLKHGMLIKIELVCNQCSYFYYKFVSRREKDDARKRNFYSLIYCI